MNDLVLFEILVTVEFEGQLDTLVYGTNANEQYVKQKVAQLQKNKQYKKVTYRKITLNHEWH